MSDTAPAPNRRGRKVCIVGFAKTSRDLALYSSEEWEIWGVNDAWSFAHRADRWFEVHSTWIYEWELRRAKGHLDWLRQFGEAGGIVYLLDARADMPHAVAFPFAEVVQNLWPELQTEGNHRTSRPYLTSSIAYMQALAIAEGFEEIAIVGVDMAADSEYCVAPETKVLTADLRWVTASEVSVGDQLIGFDEENGGATEAARNSRQWRCATVEAAERLTRPCYRLVLEDGTELISSAEHRWLTYSEHMNKWRRTDEMVTNAHRPGRPSRIVKFLNTWEEDRSWDAGYLAAAFDGEGHLTQRVHATGTQVAVGFSQRENAMSVEVNAAAERLGFKINGFTHEDGCVKYTLANGRATLLKFLGAIRPRRLLANFKPDVLGSTERIAAVAVERMEYLGELPVIGLKTSAATFVAEGFGSHNSAQKPCCEYLIGLAKGRGIKCWLPESCGLLEGPLYGRGSMNPEGERISPEQLSQRYKRLEQHKATIIQQCDGALATCQQIQGAMTVMRDLLGEFPQNGPAFKARIDDLEQQLQQAGAKRAKCLEALHQVDGALIECRYWIGLTPHGGDARLVPPTLLSPVEAPALVLPPTETDGLSGFVAHHATQGPPPILVAASATSDGSPNGVASEALEVVR